MALEGPSLLCDLFASNLQRCASALVRTFLRGPLRQSHRRRAHSIHQTTTGSSLSRTSNGTLPLFLSQHLLLVSTATPTTPSPRPFTREMSAPGLYLEPAMSRRCRRSAASAQGPGLARFRWYKMFVVAPSPGIETFSPIGMFNHSKMCGQLTAIPSRAHRAEAAQSTFTLRRLLRRLSRPLRHR